MSIRELSDRLKAEGIRLGFDQLGIAPAVPPPGYPDFLRWLDAGHAAGMEYLHRQEPARSHPEAVLEGVRSVVMVSVVYGSGPPVGDGSATPMTTGKVAQYARGADYHRVLWDMLGSLVNWLRVECPGARARAVADTAPLLERDYARLAGLGWIAKNTMLISRRLGSFTFLGALLTDLELAYDAPHHANHCGTCTRCLEACPTDAFNGPYDLDARRCISYWTIEHRGPIPDHAAGQLHGWVFGCDICQDVCPWNRKAPAGRNPELAERPEWVDPDLVGWLTDDRDDWRARLKDAAPARAKRTGLVRNAAILLGSRRVAAAAGPLAARLDDRQEDPVIRAAAAWSLSRLGDEEAMAALARNRDDPDPAVRTAVRKAEEGPTPSSDAVSAGNEGNRPARIGEDAGRTG
jgi:epoxyqueuosine reductase